eukprot:UN03129
MHMKQCNDDDPNSAKTANALEQLEEDANNAYREKNFEKVIELCKLIHNIDPTHIVAHGRAGNSYLSQNVNRTMQIFHFQKYLEYQEVDVLNYSRLLVCSLPTWVCHGKHGQD